MASPDLQRAASDRYNGEERVYAASHFVLAAGHQLTVGLAAAHQPGYHGTT